MFIIKNSNLTAPFGNELVLRQNGTDLSQYVDFPKECARYYCQGPLCLQSVLVEALEGNLKEEVIL